MQYFVYLTPVAAVFWFIIVTRKEHNDYRMLWYFSWINYNFLNHPLLLDIWDAFCWPNTSSSITCVFGAFVWWLFPNILIALRQPSGVLWILEGSGSLCLIHFLSGWYAAVTLSLTAKFRFPAVKREVCPCSLWWKCLPPDNDCTYASTNTRVLTTVSSLLSQNCNFLCSSGLFKSHTVFI